MVNTDLAPLFEFVNLFLAFATPPSDLFDLIVRVDVFEKVNSDVLRTSYAIPHADAEAVPLFNTTVSCGTFIDANRCELKDLMVYDDYDGYAVLTNNGMLYVLADLETLDKGANPWMVTSLTRRPLEVDGGIVLNSALNNDERGSFMNVLVQRSGVVSLGRYIDKTDNDQIYGFDQCRLQRFHIDERDVKVESSYDMDRLRYFGPKPPNVHYCFRAGKFVRSQFYSPKLMEFYVPMQHQPAGYRDLKSKAIVQVISIPKPLTSFLTLSYRSAVSDLLIMRILCCCIAVFTLIFIVLDVVILHFVSTLNPKYRISLFKTRKTKLKYIMVVRGPKSPVDTGDPDEEATKSQAANSALSSTPGKLPSSQAQPSSAMGVTPTAPITPVASVRGADTDAPLHIMVEKTQ